MTGASIGLESVSFHWIRGGDVVSYPHHLGAARQEVQDPVAQGGVETQGLKLDDEFGGYYVLNAEL